MTAYAIRHLADEFAVAADSLCYGPHSEPYGFLCKLAALPTIRSVLFARGKVEITHGAVARLLLSPQVLTIEDAAEALPDILRTLTEQFAVELGLVGDPTKMRLCFFALAGWSEAENRARLYSFMSTENFEPLFDADRLYGTNVAPWPPVPAEFLPVPRAADTLDDQLIGVLHGVDRYCVENPAEADGTRLGGQITKVVINERQLTTTCIGAFPDWPAALAARAAEDATLADVAPAKVAGQPTKDALRQAARRKAERDARKKARRR